MNRDPKQTQTLEQPAPRSEAPDDQDIGMRTTLVQPIPRSRQPELVRTRYWEKLSAETETKTEEPKRTAYASSSKTCVGLGPDDPIVQAVQAAKLQLLEAERKQREPERASHERPRVAEVASASSASTAKTVLLPALEVLQLMASRVKPAAERPQPSAPDEPVQLPKRKLKPLLVAASALGSILCAGALGYLLPATPPQHAEQALVQPRARAAPAAVAPETPAVVPAPAPAADSVSAPAHGPGEPQITEKAAVDALFAGDYVLAGRHYAALASAHPEQPAFAEAARILKRNTRAEAR